MGSGSRPATWAAKRMERDLAYGSHARQRLGSLPRPRREDSPTVVFAHGGSLQTGDKADEDYHDVCRQFPAAGIACANVNYRLAADAPWPAQAEDVAAAVAWLPREHRSARRRPAPAVPRGSQLGGDAGGPGRERRAVPRPTSPRYRRPERRCRDGFDPVGRGRGAGAEEASAQGGRGRLPPQPRQRHVPEPRRLPRSLADPTRARRAATLPVSRGGERARAAARSQDESQVRGGRARAGKRRRLRGPPRADPRKRHPPPGREGRFRLRADPRIRPPPA